MRKEERKLRLSYFEHRLLLGSMLEHREQLLAERKPTEQVDALILKIISAPRKRGFCFEAK